MDQSFDIDGIHINPSPSIHNLKVSYSIKLYHFALIFLLLLKTLFSIFAILLVYNLLSL